MHHNSTFLASFSNFNISSVKVQHYQLKISKRSAYSPQKVLVTLIYLQMEQAHSKMQAVSVQ